MVTKKTIITYKGRNSPTTIAVSLFGSLVDFVDAETNKMGVVLWSLQTVEKLLLSLELCQTLPRKN